MNKVRAPRVGEAITWRPKHQRLAPAPPVASVIPLAEKEEWARQVREVEDARPHSPWGPEPLGPGLDNIGPDPKSDPQGYADVVVSRLINRE